MGIELSRARKALDRAAKSAEEKGQAAQALERAKEEKGQATQALARATERSNYFATPEHLAQVLRRAEIVVPLLHPEARVLWVDDHPENNNSEREILEALDIGVDEVISTDQALARFAPDTYDLIISDMVRDGEAEAGLQLLSEMARRGIDAPVIFYVGWIDPSKGVPPGGFAITARPDELLHYILDALERRRL
jgi:CheY-like chemotaxis protein